MLESRRLYCEYARTDGSPGRANRSGRPLEKTIVTQATLAHGNPDACSGASPRADLAVWSGATPAAAPVKRSGPRLTASWLAAVTAAFLIVVLVVIPVAAAANVQVLWSNEPSLEGLRFGDFDGDGRTDVFRMSGSQWQFSSAGTGAWQVLFTDPSLTPLDDLRFGDFNGDGRTDVFSVLGTQWRYSSAGVSSWIPLATDSTPLADLRFGDFNGDGRTDVFSMAGDQWRYSAVRRVQAGSIWPRTQHRSRICVSAISMGTGARTCSVRSVASGATRHRAQIAGR